MTFSEKLTILRKRRGLSQEQLAEMLDVSRQSVSKWEAQQALPETSKIIMIGKIFNVSIDLLLKDENSIGIDDVPKTVYAPQPKKVTVNTPPTPKTVNVKPLGMAWYKFLIYFSLIAGAIINLIYSFNYISGDIYFVETNGEVSAEQVYARYGTNLKIVDVFYGFFLIAFAILAFVVRHKLANYEHDSIKHVKIFYSLSAGVPFVYAILVAAITGQSLAVQAITSAIVGLVFLFMNIKYFKKRAHLFVKKNAAKQPTKPPAISPEKNLSQETINKLFPVINTLNHAETLKKSKNKPIITGIVSVVAIVLITVLIILLIGNTGKDTDIHNIGVRTISFEDKFTAEYVLATWENGQKTEKSIIDIMDEYGSEQGGGQLYIITRGEFVEEIEEWCFSSKRKKGDYAIIENAYGFSLCYYSGYNLEKEDFNDIQNNGNSLVVAVEPEFYPYSWEENGKFYGLHVDIAKEMAKRNGFSVEFVSANWEDLFVGIENGTYNLVLGIEPTEDRQEAFFSTAADFTDVYYDGMAAMFNVKEFELTFSEWSNFKFTIKEMVEDGTIASYLAKYDLKS